MMVTAATNDDTRGDGAGRLPRLAAQTPGLDIAQEARTLRDAEAYFAGAEERSSRHILVPLAAAALPYATAARLSLLAVLETPPARFGLPSDAGREEDERRVAASAASLTGVTAPLRATGLAVTSVVRHGNPADTILIDSEDEACSLVVMATNGRTGVDRARMGSVAQHIFRHAAIPTLVVRPGDDEPTALRPRARRSRRRSTARRRARGAAHAAAGYPQSLRLRLFRLGYRLRRMLPLTPEMEREEERAIADHLEAVAAPLHAPGLAVRTCWRRSPTTRAEDCVAAYLAERPTGIAVMAIPGRGGVLRWALGSTVEAVLDQTPCPILIIRAGATTSAGHEAVPIRTMQYVR